MLCIAAGFGIPEGLADDMLPSGVGAVAQHDLALAVGCRFTVHSLQPVTAILQVAPYPEPTVSIRCERWATPVEHYSYLDHYGNRCERFAFGQGSSQVDYEEQTNLLTPSDLIVPDAPETPVAALPAEVLSVVMPSRFCLPDGLGHEAWQRFGHISPGWGRVQAVVD